MTNKTFTVYTKDSKFSSICKKATKELEEGWLTSNFYDINNLMISFMKKVYVEGQRDHETGIRANNKPKKNLEKKTMLDILRKIDKIIPLGSNWIYIEKILKDNFILKSNIEYPSFNKYLAEKLKDPVFKKEYEKQCKKVNKKYKTMKK